MNIIRFLEEHKIHYITSGNNVKRNNVNVTCPFCAQTSNPDISEHLGISLSEPHVYGCWRNDKHRDRDITNLIKVLLGCTWLEAKRIVEDDKPLLEKESMLSRVESILNKDKQEQEVCVDALTFPEEFKEVNDCGVYRRFYSYLYSRGFRKYDIQNLKAHFHLKGCFRNDFAWRLILPVYYEGKLVSWTGRSIRKDAKLRYLDLAINKSVIPLKDCLYDLDNLIKRRGRKLYIVEGSFDTFPIFLWGDEDVGITCTFTISVSNNQKFLLSRLAHNYDEIVIIPDRGFKVQAIKLKLELAFLNNVRIQELPAGFSDPGELTREAVKEFVR